MRRIAAAALAVLFAGLLAPRASIASEETRAGFQKAKQQVKSAAYADALKTIEGLEAELGKPGNEEERKMAGPPLLFYRGVCEAALGRGDAARATFRTFLATMPNASIDPGMYPKAVLAAFDDAKKGSGAAPAPPAGGRSSSIGEQYARFHPAAPPAGLEGDGWGTGPTRFLMTPEESRQWTAESDAQGRSEFITKFWASRDPDPNTPENEFRSEFERRVAFADAALAQGEKRGSLTDRGMVFVLLGPPTFLTQRKLAVNEDAMGSQSVFSSRSVDTTNNLKETWQYRRDRLPPGVPYQQVDFTFITRQGYGENVMQREPDALTTLDAAKKPRPAG
ncbi:MAG: GWxTD domain-containing protein [Acidobacteriota bacterium]